MATRIKHNWFGRVSRKTDRQQRVFLRRCYKQHFLSDYDLWDILSSQYSPVGVTAAIAIYEDLGFQAFAGYPLQPQA